MKVEEGGTIYLKSHSPSAIILVFATSNVKVFRQNHRLQQTPKSTVQPILWRYGCPSFSRAYQWALNNSLFGDSSVIHV